MSKIFTYQENGLSYTVTIYEENGIIKADITVTEGSMDVNAVYFGDDDFSGDSAGLSGPLNMNGSGSSFEGETVQWDDAIALSRPGLGSEGTDKDTFLQAGDTMTIDLDGVDSIDDIDFFGIRATSVNGGDSIKAVSGNPETVDDDNGDDDDAATYEKVFFVLNSDASSGNIYEWDNFDPEMLEAAGLEPDAEGTFANYVAVFEDNGYFSVDELQEVRFFETSDEGYLREIEEMRIVAPEGGFADADALIAAYDEMIAEMSDDISMDGLMVAMSADEEADIPASEDDDEEDAAVSVM
ncbi:hypothetical protein [Roseinatronobacter alkalisoli]|uniref:Uncharacterized protein n=1 Tax=Roseinatronobacter alkalisoli TaxID=3028235 RepID=A0ABT5TBK8_9RHOB|nr:hypothetical protein [Roseinatronobacter sp. HJB301]MDD7972505.1 hypothetical protein [Roseinatronobacter sp. HJB301]